MGLAGFRRFVARFTLFLLPAAGAELALEAKLASVENSYSLKRRSLEEDAPSLEVLILGPSHAYYGIDPDHLSRPSLNLANVSQSLQIDAQLASMVLARAPRLRLVLLSFGYFSLGYSTETGGEPWRNGFTHFFYGIQGDQEPWMLLHPRNYSLLALYGPEQTRGMALRGFTSTLADNVSPRGFYAAEPRPASLILDEKDGEKRVRTHESLQSEEARGANTAALGAMVAALGARSVKVAFVTLPVHATYARFMDREVWKRSQAVIRGLVREGAVSYHDYLEDGRFGVEDFRDHDHLCAAGAAKMTRILEEEVVKAALSP
ncbi:MAG: hypothetical protein U0359_29125 [Byssovorax sp.]